jgi:hypothetical protein
VSNSAAGSLVGLLDGTYFILGDFDQCLAVRYPNGQGQYALLQLRPAFKFTSHFNSTLDARLNQLFFDPHFVLRVGVCLPSSCDKQDIRSVFDACKYKAVDQAD